MKKVTVTIPTYNEKENITLLIPALEEVFATLSKEYDPHILVVDDTSPDGTGDIVRNFQKQYPNVHLLEGKKQGLGVACIKGYQHGMHELGSDYIIEMDADFSHDPKVLPTMLDAMGKDGVNFVIGSRYIPGGSIPHDWALIRKLNSKFGNIFARYIAGIPYVHDCTSGYRCMSADILKKINFNTIDVSGYSFLMNILYFAVKKGAIVKEVPIQFVDRKYGESKISLKDIIEFVKSSFLLRFKKVQ